MAEKTETDCRKIRKKIFTGHYAVDQQLSRVCTPVPSHGFLANPASQIIYQFLLRYTVELSEIFFQKERQNITILDWGCGKGHCSYLLNKSGVTVYACDVNNNSGDSAFGQETPIIKEYNINVRPLEHEYILPYQDNTFDAVLSMGVLEHVPNDLLSLKEIHRVLRNGGLFFCYFLPQRYSWTQYVARKRGDNYHDRLYTRNIVEELLATADFHLIDFWHRQLFPKNNVKYFFHHFFELLDQHIVKFTPLKHLATNIEFVARK